jgi:hypothetical protein
MAGIITAAAITAGAGMYSAKQAGKAGKVQPAVDIFEKNKEGTNLAGRQATGLIDYYGEYPQQFLELSKKLGPEFMSQMFSQTGQFLGGVNGQPGFNALQLSSAQQAGQTLGQVRAEELGLMTGQTGLTRGLMQSLSPEQAAVVQASVQEAQRARASAQGVTPEEKRMYEQSAREAFQSSGRLGGNASIVSEAMGRESLMQQKRQEAAAAEADVFKQAGSFYTSPGLQALSAAPLAYNAGGKDLALGLQLGPASSGEFDYNMPINLAMTQAGAKNQSNMAQYSANAAASAAKAKAYGSLGSDLAGLGMDYYKANKNTASSTPRTTGTKDPYYTF